MSLRRYHLAPLAAHLIVIGALVTPAGATAGPACVNLPPSTLRVLDIKGAAVDEVRVPGEALDHTVTTDGLGSRHTMMLTTADVITLVRITHRIVQQPDGFVCDAPTNVDIGFGLGRRIAYLARDAAVDACVHQTMLAHEDAHNRRFNATVDRFIDEQQSSFARGMSALKQTPAASADLAKARWEQGVRVLVEEAKRQLLRELREANTAIDDAPSLANLADACGGKIRALEKAGGL
jgi:hypothetical protein